MGIKTKQELKLITDELVDRLLNTSGVKIDKIILYGSYARGDAGSDSDIDIMVLCDNREDELDKRRFEVNTLGSRLSLENDIDVSLVIKDIDTFYEWKNVVPFYQNIEKDGVILYG